MDPVAARKAIAGIRLGMGLGCLVAPRLIGRLFRIDATANPAAPYLTRLFGARELYMAAPFLMPSPGLDEAELAARAVPVDAADALAAFAAGVRGYLPWRAALPAGLAGLAGTYLGSIAAENENKLSSVDGAFGVAE